MLSEKSFRRRRGIYYSFLGGSYLGMGISLLALVALVVYIVIKGAPNLSLDLLFGEYSSRSPSIVPAMLGTLYLVLISLGIGPNRHIGRGVPKRVFEEQFAHREGYPLGCGDPVWHPLDRLWPIRLPRLRGLPQAGL